MTKKYLYLANLKNFSISIKSLLVKETDLFPVLFAPGIKEDLWAISSSVKVTSIVKGGRSLYGLNSFSLFKAFKKAERRMALKI